MKLWRAVLRILALIAISAGLARAQEAAPTLTGDRQSLDGVWWTGPLLAPNAWTLPRGHFLIEPYLYDVLGAHSNGFGSLTYINYGLANRFTARVIPTFGYNQLSDGLSSGSN